MLPFYAAMAETASAIAALNARALHRAGLLNYDHVAAMHRLLHDLEEKATLDEQHQLLATLRKAIPKRAPVSPPSAG